MVQLTKKAKWDKVSRANPCPICDRPDWCLTTGPVDSPDAVICARIESAKRVGSQGAGWLHRLRDDDNWRDRPRSVRVKAVDGPPDGDFARLAGNAFADLGFPGRALLARELGVTSESLSRLHVGWAPKHRAFTFPMRDGDGNVCGIRLRRIDGRKLAVKGSRQGLFIPANVPIVGPLLICEGPTDTSALLDLHFDAVGRPSCTGGAQLLVELVRDWHPDEVSIIADADAPGQRGASYLASRLAGYVASGVRVVTPPAGAKDAREWVKLGATRDDVLQAIEAAPLLKLTYGVRAVAE